MNETAHLAQTIWDSATPITRGDLADRYLRQFGVTSDDISDQLRFHPRLEYFQRFGRHPFSRGTMPALVAAIHDDDYRLVSLHRIYLGPTRFGPVALAQKRLTRLQPGNALRLGKPEAELVITIDLESAVAVRRYLQSPTWAVLEPRALLDLAIPDSVRYLDILAADDSDADFRSQAAAYSLAQRFHQTRRDRQVRVHIPPHPGQTWSDVWRMRSSAHHLARISQSHSSTFDRRMK
ncbi:hypothetical protein E4L96_19945 [Massilia arenosa]|uniref:DUF7146 domain-containing protein n=1 Tax=Zemynaea arenosa TaxID=2561931 RepID=A0A4Y9RWM2_9BURK|nr:hypothetical protein [Massilia arenosa]TFW13372.1 hypothetical protein E4L96_19945 [Massilia arenosa]